MCLLSRVRNELILSYIEGAKTFEALSIILKENYHVSDDNICFILNDNQRHVIPAFSKRWTEASRKKDRFLMNNSDWLDTEYSVTLPISGDITIDSTPSTSYGKRGRPCVTYTDSSQSGKKRKNSMLLNEYGFEHMRFRFNESTIFLLEAFNNRTKLRES